MPADFEQRWWTLPRRDLVLLPLILIGTMLLLLVPTELIVRNHHPAELVDRCVVETASMTVANHGKPHCMSRTKAPEGPWVNNNYNACGYRSPEPCGPKPADSLRVAVIGSSIAAGYLIPFDDSFAERSAKALTAQCARPVEFQNLGSYGNIGGRLVVSAKEAMTLNPDALVIPIDPFDLDPVGAKDNLGASQARKRGILAWTRSQISGSSLLYMASYYLLQDDASYLPFYLGTARGADFLRLPMPIQWRASLAAFDQSLARVAAISRARSVPVLIVFVPQRAQAALAAMPRPDPDFHADTLPALLATIARKHGFSFADTTQRIPRNLQSSKFFYAVNGHMNGDGHELVSRAVVAAMTAQTMHAFARKCMPQRSAASTS